MDHDIIWMSFNLHQGSFRVGASKTGEQRQASLEGRSIKSEGGITHNCSLCQILCAEVLHSAITAFQETKS